MDSIEDARFATGTIAGAGLERVARDASGTQLAPLLARRFSPRAMQGTAIPPELITRLFDAARWAPSSRNEQPWEFVVVRREQAEAHAAAVDVLMPRNRLWAGDAGLLVLGIARATNADGSPNAFAQYDLGQAVAHLSLQATAEGLRVHQMGGFDSVRARAAFAVPEGHEPTVMIAIGYPGDAALLPEDMRRQEASPRVRRPLDAFVFEGRFGGRLAG